MFVADFRDKKKVTLNAFSNYRHKLYTVFNRTGGNIYIIDTNVFVNCPSIISRIGKQYRVIIPATVLEELDKLKLKDDVDKKNINEAAKNIHIAFTQKYSSMENADVSLLPSGFDKKNPDCMILSIALKYQKENPIILTSDYVLQSRASGLGISTITLKEFLRKPS